MWKSKRTDQPARYAKARARMVDNQIATRGVIDPNVLAAMRHVPRHAFIPTRLRTQAYEDHPVQIGHGQTISQPYMVAIMTQSLDLTPEDRVLEIGTGSGYQTAILAELAKEVISIERNESLAETARDRLEGLGCDNVTVLAGDGTLGYPEGAPYDAILVTAAGPDVPSSLKAQLAVGGRLVCPAGPRDCQQLITITRTDTGLKEDRGISCVFVPLIGDEGWPER